MKTIISTLLVICLLLVDNNNCNAKGSSTSLTNLNPYFNTNGLGLKALHNAEVDSNKRKDRKTRTLTSPLITTKKTTVVTDTTPTPPPPPLLQQANVNNETVLFQQAAIVGLISATMGHIYGLILDRSVNVVWKDIPNFILGSVSGKLGPSYIFYTMSIGGLIMGILSIVLQKTYIVADFVSALSGSDSDASLLPELLPALPNLLVLSLITSTFGFSVGPEAPMVCAGTLIGKGMSSKWYQEQPKINKHLESHQIKKARQVMLYAGAAGALTAFMGTPLAGAIFVLELTCPSSGMCSLAKDALVPAVAASVVALMLIRGVLDPHSSVGGHFTYLPVEGILSGRAAIATSLICGVGGAFLGTLFHKLVHFLKDVLWKIKQKSKALDERGGSGSPLIHREILAKTTVGIIVGLLSMKYPTTMFWGEGSLQCAIDGQETPFTKTKHGFSRILTRGAIVDPSAPFQSAWAAAQVGCGAKLLAIALACAGKFPGGIIFPLFFAAAPIAHSALMILGSYLPESVSPVAIMALMASTQASVTRTPLATVFMLALSSSAGTELSNATFCYSIVLHWCLGVSVYIKGILLQLFKVINISIWLVAQKKDTRDLIDG